MREGWRLYRKERKKKEQNSIIHHRKERKEHLNLDLGGADIKLCFQV